MDSNISYSTPPAVPTLPPSSPSLLSASPSPISPTTASFLTDSFITTTTTTTSHDIINVTDTTPHWSNLSSFEKFCGNSPFWDPDLFLNSPYPNFTPCFRQVGLAWIPCMLYIVLSLPYIIYLRKLSPVPSTRGAASISKMIFTICLLGVTIATIIVRAKDDNQGALFVSEGLKVFCFILSIIVSQMEHPKGQVSSPLNWTFWLILLIASVVPFYSFLEEDTLRTDRVGFIIFYIYFALVFINFIVHSFAEPKKQEYQDLSRSISKCPSLEPTASIPSRISFWWMTSLVILGFKRTIEEDDIHDLVPEDKCETMMPDFLTSWQRETARVEKYNSKVVAPKTPTVPSYQGISKKNESHEDKKKPPKSPFKSASVLRVLMSDHGFIFFLSMTAKAAFDLLRFLTPMITEALIDFISNRDKYYQWRGYILALAYLVVNQIVSIGSNQAIFYTKRAGFRMRATLINAIYRKSLTATSMGDETTRGEVVNLMSVDCQRIEDISNYIFYAFSAPLQIVLAFYLLYQQLGVAMFAGMGVMIVMVPINGIVGHLFAKWTDIMMKYKDDRVNLLSEVLNGIKVLKLYAWEGSFQEKIEKIRAKELAYLAKFFNVDAILMYCFMALPSLVQVASYGARIADKGYLDPSVAFVSLQLFNMLNEPLTLLPLLIPFLIQTMVSIRRISAYLNRPDIKPDAVRIDLHAENDIRIENGEFTWSMDRELSTLRNINLEIKPGSLVAVVGTVGCGKSSLLSAMLGEMERVSGTVTLKGNIAYVPQQAWIQNGTVKDNIIFGKVLHKRKYGKILDACALTSDLAILPGGDQTEIGEKGINISGGQKQRVSLARAVYSDRDIYLMDDPLSAVDSHVGKHIFEQVIGEDGVLKRKTRVLVTHGVQYLPRVDKIFVVSNGVISETGTYTELQEKDGDFAQFLKEYAQENSDKSEENSEVEDHVFDEEQRGSPPRMLRQVSWKETSFSDRSHESEKTLSMKRRKHSRSHSESSQRQQNLRRGSPVRRHSSRWGDSSLGHSSQFTAQKAGTKLIEDEIGMTGRIKFQVYLYYMKEIGAPACIFILLLYLLFAAASVFSAVWLTIWTGDEYLLNVTNKDTAEYSEKTNDYLSVYAGASVGQGLFVCIVAFLVANRVVKASKNLHNNMLRNVLRCPMSFFDTTPIGRIQNRFSRDVEVLDDMLPFTLRQTLSYFGTVVITITNISYGTPIFLAALVPLAIIYFAIQAVYIPTIRQLRRINSVTRSPIYVHFSETLGGTSSIRAYECQDRFVNESMDKIDYNIKFYFSSVAAASWLSFRLQFLGNLVVFAAAIFAVAATNIDPGVVGLSMSYATSMTDTLEKLVSLVSEVETNIVSVERLKEYTYTPREAEWVLDHHRPNPSWPEEGNIIFDNYQTRYRPGLELVLKDVSCTIKGGEKVGIVGRTGAGKSSMTVGLFRIIESAGGRIVIDGEDVSQMGLHDLRNKITILPQDPVIFSGSMRMNLDPFSKYTEPEIWDALEHSYLKEFVEGLPERLEYECGEEGANLSVGQRQLVCLARTLLRKTKILVLDEATAAVDMETDDLIQQTIRREFSDCTILTIAHRLNTIMDYDKVMVLDKGCIKELDSPQALLADENGVFRAMAADAGLL